MKRRTAGLRWIALGLVGGLSACGVPETATIVIEPADPTSVDDLVARLDREDATLTWFRDGSATSETSGTVSADATAVGEVWRVEATWEGGSAGAEVSVRNSPPVILSVLGPTSSPSNEDIVLDAVASDPDGDPVLVRWEWTIGDTVVSTSAGTLPGYTAANNQVVTWRLTPDDGVDLGAPSEGQVVITNGVPRVNSVQITPAVASARDRLGCDWTGIDSDNDEFVPLIEWYVNGEQVGTGARLATGYLRDDVVTCQLILADNEGISEPSQSAPVTIINAVPSVAAARISPAAPAVGDQIVCLAIGFVDPDGDEDQSPRKWFLDGVAVGIGYQFPGNPQPGQSIECVITPNDGIEQGEDVSISVGVVNQPPGGNLLVIVADDLGVDAVGAFGYPTAAPTPVLDELADTGLLFRRAYASSMGASTRAGMLTGREGFRTGIGTAITDGGYGLPLDLVGLPIALDYATNGSYSHGAVGKWGLVSDDPGGRWHPELFGFDRYVGSFGNLDEDDLPGTGEPGDYFEWVKTQDGERSVSQVYATTDTVDEALAMIAALPEPWLVLVSFNAPRAPYHVPPADLHSFADLTEQSPLLDTYMAMVESMDTEIGRLLATMDPAVLDETTVVFVGDNGTPGGATQSPFAADKAKGTVYEGGVHVPLIINGPLVWRAGQVEGLVQTTDLYTTLLDLAGAEPTTAHLADLDAVSLMPYLNDPTADSIRSVAYSARFSPNGLGPYNSIQTTVRDDRWRLVSNGGVHELYDLAGEIAEGNDLLLDVLDANAQTAYDHLVVELEAVGGP